MKDKRYEGMSITIRKVSEFPIFYNAISPKYLVDMQKGIGVSLEEFQARNILIGYSGEPTLLSLAEKQSKQLSLPLFTFGSQDISHPDESDISLEGAMVVSPKKNLWQKEIPSVLVSLLKALKNDQDICLWLIIEANRPIAEMLKRFLCGL